LISFLNEIRELFSTYLRVTLRKLRISRQGHSGFNEVLLRKQNDLRPFFSPLENNSGLNLSRRLNHASFEAE
jgi:hypothetical protein